MKATYKFEESDLRRWVYIFPDGIHVERIASKTGSFWKSFVNVTKDGEVVRQFSGARGFGVRTKAEAWSVSREAFDHAIRYAKRIGNKHA